MLLFIPRYLYSWDCLGLYVLGATLKVLRAISLDLRQILRNVKVGIIADSQVVVSNVRMLLRFLHFRMSSVPATSHRDIAIQSFFIGVLSVCRLGQIIPRLFIPKDCG